MRLHIFSEKTQPATLSSTATAVSSDNQPKTSLDAIFKTYYLCNLGCGIVYVFSVYMPSFYCWSFKWSLLHGLQKQKYDFRCSGEWSHRAQCWGYEGRSLVCKFKGSGTDFCPPAPNATQEFMCLSCSFCIFKWKKHLVNWILAIEG